jgi:tetratricopeptide (TPR) repeat protein
LTGSNQAASGKLFFVVVFFLTLVPVFFGSVQSAGSSASGDTPDSIGGNITRPTTATVAKPETYQGNDSSSAYQRGNYFYEKGDYEQALQWFEKALSSDPGDFDSLVGKADSLYRLGRYEDASVSYENALKIEPADFDSWMGKGSSLYNLGLYTESLTAFEKAIEIKPENSYAWYDRGNAFYRLGDYELAVHDFAKGESLNPINADVGDNKELALDKLVESVIGKDLNSTQGALLLREKADKLFDQQKYEGALAIYEKVLEMDSENISLLIRRGNTEYAIGGYEDALASYQKAEGLSPDDPIVWYDKALALHKMGRNNESLVAVERSLEINSSDSSAWYNRGVILEDIGKQDMALASYDKALEINPTHLSALINKGYLLNSLGRYEESLDFFEQAIGIDLSDPVTFNGQGSSLFGLGRYAEALSSYIEATELDSSNTAAWNGVGASYEKLGIYGDALKAYQKVLEIDPENSFAADSISSIKNIVTSKVSGSTIATDGIPANTTTTIANSSGSASKHILAMNLGHGYLLNGSGLIEVFNHDRNQMLLNNSFIVGDYLDTQYLEFDAGNSQTGDYLSVCIDEVERIGYSCDSFYYYPDSYKYQINIDLQDIDQYITDKNGMLELLSPSVDEEE